MANSGSAARCAERRLPRRRRYQPTTIVPSPSASATDTFTQVGMNLGPLSNKDRRDFNLPTSPLSKPGGDALITRTASEAA